MNFWDQIAGEKHLLDFPQTPYGPLGLLYPNTYSIGISSLGFQQVYRLFRQSGVSVERIFYDPQGRETRSVENRTPLFRFPILGATYTYELDLVNLITMLIRGGVPPLSEQREEGSPILIVGGMAATANPRILERIADAVALGEGEGIVEAVSRAWIANAGHSRRQCLEALAELPHLYVPAVHGAFDRNRFSFHELDPINAFPCHTVILPQNDEFGGAFLLEMSRGCTYRCKFCIVHYMNGSGRYRDFSSLIEILERYQDTYRKVGLLGAAVADHPQVVEVTEWLVRRGKQVSTSSLRAEKISERFLDLLRDGGQHTITVAPETGATSSRREMLKGVRDEKYFRLAEWAGKRRFTGIKLYFLIGVPGADPMQEASEIIQFGQTMSDLFTANGGGRIVVSVSPFVPKPTTPWEGEGLWDPKMVKKASRLIRKMLAFRGNVKVPPVNVKEALAETALTWAGPEITDELLRLAQGEISLENAFKDYHRLAPIR